MSDEETAADPHVWSGVAQGWAELWGGLAAPAWRALADATGIAAGSRTLDVGCGSGEFVAYLDGLGASAAGVDPDRGMVAIARSRVATADIRIGSAEQLPWPDGAFDVVTAINALQFAEDTDDALAELARVAVPGGLVGISNWAESNRNDLRTIDAAIASAAGVDISPDGGLRTAGGLQGLLRDGGLDVVAAGLVEVVWETPDDDVLVRGVLLGEGPKALEAAAPVVLAAARPFRTAAGGYRFVNAFRYAIGRAPG
jgi:SAM-dependent methyltransferase